MKAITEFNGSYRFLSNFWPVEIVFEGTQYPSTEHAFQAAKTLNNIERREIAGARTADQAKRMGRNIRLRPDWENVKLQVMYRILKNKFNPKGTDAQRELAQHLDGTGNLELIEGNYWGDTFWGVCRGKGANHLGKLLMQIREENRISHG